MKKRVAAVMIGLGGIALGASLVHAGGNGAHEPLWAYGFLTPPAPAEKTVRQNPPARRGLRPNEDPVEQTRIRRIPGSSAAFSLVDIRDGQNLIAVDEAGRRRLDRRGHRRDHCVRGVAHASRCQPPGSPAARNSPAGDHYCSEIAITDSVPGPAKFLSLTDR